MLKLDPSYLVKGHYVKNGLWFTEDHIPVRKLFLSNIPEYMKEDILVEHFNSFGSVISVQLFDNATQKYGPNRILSRVYGRQRYGAGVTNTSSFHKEQRKCGFVLFANASDATKALEMKMHHVNDYRIYAIVADSWHQPDLYETSEPPTSSDQSGEANIFKLNDDCLSRILEFLPLADQVHFQRVCMRFQSVYHLTARSIHKSVDLQKLNNLTLLDIREFFRISGPYVTDIKCNSSSTFDKRLLNYFGRNCINLKSLELSNSDLSTKNMFKIFSITSKLEYLTLGNCILTDEKVLALMNLNHLKKLNLGQNFSIAYLNLMDCENISSENLIQVFKSLTNLRELNMVGYYSNLAKLFKYMVENGCCPLLETLGLSICGLYEDIGQLPQLKSIHIYGISEEFYVTKFFDQLVLFKSEQLEELKIIRDTTKQTLMKIGKLNGLKTLTIWNAPNIDDDVLAEFTNLGKLEYIDLSLCKQVNDSNVLRLVLGCPKLQEVNLSGCLQITVKLLENIILKIPIYYKKNERKLPIKVYFKLNTFIPTSIQTPAAQDILKIICKQFDNLNEQLI